MTDVDAMLDSLADDIDSLPDERKDLLMGKIEGHKTFTVPEVSELLALSETTIRRKLRDGEISGVQTGNGWRISRADLEEWWGSQGGETLFNDDREGTRRGYTLTSETKEGWERIADESGVDELADLQPGMRVKCQPLEGGGWLLIQVLPDGTNDMTGGEVLAKVPPEKSEYFDGEKDRAANILDTLEEDNDDG